jgi:hypothetical protein
VYLTSTVYVDDRISGAEFAIGHAADPASSFNLLRLSRKDSTWFQLGMPRDAIPAGLA